MRYCIAITLLLWLNVNAFSQESAGLFSLSEKKQAKFIGSVTERFSKLDKQIISKIQKTLTKLRKQEYKIYKKLYKKDSVAAIKFLEESKQKYSELESKLTQASQGELKEFLPAYDTLKNTLSFLSKNLKSDNPLANKLLESKKVSDTLSSRLQVANEIKKQLKERKAILVEHLQQFNLTKDLKKLNKEMFYYQEHLKEFKSVLNDPKKIEQKAIAALRNSKAFQEFMKKNSMLAKLFRVPDNYGTLESLEGLQTRASVDGLITARLAGAGVDPREFMQGQMNQAKAELSKIKGRLDKLKSGSVGNSSSDIDMPENFKPNTQKTKSFLKRFEYGANFQTHKPNGYFPVTTDVALTLGYKLNDKSVIGFGAAYKIGWGSNIENIKLTHEGIALRSYVDMKLRGSFWITGGYEQNHYQRFVDLQQLNNMNVWRQSGLVGMTKKIKVGKKESKVQLLFDVMYKQNNTTTQPLIFRVGYSF